MWPHALVRPFTLTGTKIQHVSQWAFFAAQTLVRGPLRGPSVFGHLASFSLKIEGSVLQSQIGSLLRLAWVGVKGQGWHQKQMSSTVRSRGGVTTDSSCWNSLGNTQGEYFTFSAPKLLLQTDGHWSKHRNGRNRIRSLVFTQRYQDTTALNSSWQQDTVRSCVVL